MQVEDAQIQTFTELTLNIFIIYSQSITIKEKSMWNKIKEIWDEAWDNIKSAWSDFGASFKELFMQLLKDTGSFAKNVVINFFKAVYNLLAAPLRTTWNVLYTVICKTIYFGLKYLWDKFLGYFTKK